MGYDKDKQHTWNYNIFSPYKIKEFFCEISNTDARSWDENNNIWHSLTFMHIEEMADAVTCAMAVIQANFVQISVKKRKQNLCYHSLKEKKNTLT